jgi:hypothetical protein
MRIRRHRSDSDEVRDEPAWVSGKPVWSVVRIEAPQVTAKAASTRSADEHDAHRPSAAA